MMQYELLKRAHSPQLSAGSLNQKKVAMPERMIKYSYTTMNGPFQSH
jgi:hypothetical protein